MVELVRCSRSWSSVAVAAVMVALAAGGAACRGGATVAPSPPLEGGISGLVRELGTGDPVAMAKVEVFDQALGALAAPAVDARLSDQRGLYFFNSLPEATYRVRAEFAGSVVEMTDVPVVRGRMVSVDLPFSLGAVEPLLLSYGNARDGAIDRYRPRHAPADRGLIEGTVSDAGTRERVVGAVVTVTPTGTVDARQEVTDDQGRFLFRDLPPATYTVSAYYSVGGRAQIEVQRNGVLVVPAEAVVAPMWIEVES